MRRALIELLRKVNINEIDSVLIDWNDKYKFLELEKDPIFVIGWDGKVLEIWAASIIAKVFRDKLIDTYSLLYPNLNLENHKWYGTKKHIDYLTWINKVTWIHRISYKPVKKVLEQKEKLLLHICCWPDATIPILDLKDQYDITCFWYDPNIHPKSEYNKRLKAFKKVCEIESIPYIVWEYDTKTYFEQTKWLEQCPEKWERCRKCYDFRLKRTLEETKKLGISSYTTTLTISPHKDENKIFETWITLNKINKEQFIFFDFKKNDWFKRSIEYTKTHQIYRQNYCGCVYSKKKN
jgi:ribonuclease HII